jgi:hypothetical protein
MAGERDEVGLICEASAMFKSSPTTFVLATDSAFWQYVEACESVLPELDEAMLIHLRYALKAGILDLVVSDVYRLQKPLPEVKTSQECGSTRRKVELQDLRPQDKGAYERAELKPLLVPSVPANLASQAFRNAEVVKFDARRTLPFELFGMTWERLHELHSNVTGDIPVMLNHGFEEKGPKRCWEWFRYYTSVSTEWGARSIRSYFARLIVHPFMMWFSCPSSSTGSTLAELANLSKDLHTEEIPHSAFVIQPQYLKVVFDHIVGPNGSHGNLIECASVNVRRLPNFAPNLDFAGLFGLSGVVEHSNAVISGGHCQSEVQMNWQDSVIFQLSGVDEIIVFPPNCTAVTSEIPLRDSVHTWVMKNQKEGDVKVPFYHIRLRAGEAVIIPSMAVHIVKGLHSARFSLSVTFEPKLGQMAWPGAPSHFQGLQRPSVGVMRVLWARSIKRLWDTKKVTFSRQSSVMDVL